MKMTLYKVNGLSSLFLLWSLPVAALQCPPGTYHVRSHLRSAYYRADGTFVKATHVSESCRGKNAVYDTWAFRLKSGFPPGWENKTERPTQWTEEQRERVLEALGELPEALRKASLKGIYRLSKSIFHPNPASDDNEGIMVLYDSAFDKGQRLARIVAHELAHETYVALGRSSQTSYRKALGWKFEYEPESRKFLYKERAGNFVADDGRQGPMEDFANNLEYYLFEPNVLKGKTPKAFDWMKKHFGDKFKVGKGSE
jgi:hypothetical protein